MNARTARLSLVAVFAVSTVFALISETDGRWHTEPSFASRGIEVSAAPDEDVWSLANMRLADQVGGAPGGVATDGNAFYAAIGPRILLVANPGGGTSADLEILATSEILPGPVLDMVAAAGIVYAAVEPDQLVVLDRLEDRMWSLGSIRMITPAYSLGLIGDHVLATSWTQGVEIIDVSDPRRPRRVHSFTTPVRAFPDNENKNFRTVIDGDRAFVFYTDNYGIEVQVAAYELSETASPILAGVGVLPVLYNPRSLTARDSRLFGIFQHGIGVFDLSDVESPSMILHVDPYSDIRPSALVYDGRHLFLMSEGPYGDRRGVTVLDAIEPAAGLPEIGHLEIDLIPVHAAVSGSDLVVGHSDPDGGDAVVLAIDVSLPAAPKIASTLRAPGVARAVAVHRNTLFAGNSAEIRAMSPDNLLTLARLLEAPTRSVEDLLPDGTLLFAAIGQDGVKILDITNPSDGRVIGDVEHRFGDRTHFGRLALGDRWVFASATMSTTAGGRGSEYTYRLCAIDASDPTSAHVAGSVEIDAAATDIATRGDTVFALTAGQLLSFDMTDPEAIVPLWKLPVSADTHSLALLGVDRLLVADAIGLTVVDVSNPFVPAVAGSFVPDSPRGEILALGTRGEIVYALLQQGEPDAAGFRTTLRRIELDRDGEILESGRTSIPMEPAPTWRRPRIAADEDTVFIAALRSGIVSVDVLELGGAPAYLPAVAAGEAAP